MARGGEKKEPTVSVRMALHNLEAFQILAAIDGTTVGEQVRTAIRQYVATRAHEKKFKKELRAAKRRQLGLLKALRSGPITVVRVASGND